ncbi:hypothetical protein L3Q82_020900 [Scortum barcoo]|uniref:Uncharacterized protein n=1 Tax=Scortum barcoo TaxID=214431 RepID=A0ACB8VA55_9TELE|nr:hypothetical protein L3Q82_020900 [Scortum barcoo]
MNTMFEHKGVHQCTWHQGTPGRRLMINFVVVSSDLSGRMSWTLGYCEGELLPDYEGGWGHCRVDNESREHGPLRLSLKLWTQDLWCLPNPLVDTGSQASHAASLGGPGGKNSGLGGSSVRPWRRTIGRHRRNSGKPSSASEGEAVLCQYCLQCGWGAVDLSWGHCRTVVRNTSLRISSIPTDMPSTEEAEAGDFKSLDVVGLSWLTRLCSIAWRFGDSVPLECKQTGVRTGGGPSF